jgi:hypothetical protein
LGRDGGLLHTTRPARAAADRWDAWRAAIG